MKNRVRVIIILTILILGCCTLSGCESDWKYFFYSNAKCERIAKKALQERFGEEFVVKGMYSQYYEEFYAYCSPVRDDDIIFKARFCKEGYIIDDDYLGGIIANEVVKYVEDDLHKLWPGCYVACWETNGKGTKELARNPRETTMQDYIENSQDGYVMVDIYIPKDVILTTSAREEYDYFWSEKNVKDINSKLIYNLAFNICVVDADTMKQVIEHWKTHSDFRGYQYVYDAERISWCTGPVNECDDVLGKHICPIDYDEYAKRREEALKNE